MQRNFIWNYRCAIKIHKHSQNRNNLKTIFKNVGNCKRNSMQYNFLAMVEPIKKYRYELL